MRVGQRVPSGYRRSWAQNPRCLFRYRPVSPRLSRPSGPRYTAWPPLHPHQWSRSSPDRPPGGSGGKSPAPYAPWYRRWRRLRGGGIFPSHRPRYGPISCRAYCVEAPCRSCRRGPGGGLVLIRPARQAGPGIRSPTWSNRGRSPSSPPRC